MKKQMKSLMNKIFYFDYNATHPPITSLIHESWNEYADAFFNPSGSTRFSLFNQAKIEKSRNFFSLATGFPSPGIVFSSSGTEANHLLIANLRNKFPQMKKFITSSFEHSSFISALQIFGFEPILLETNLSGIISLEHLKNLLEEESYPVGIIYAGNETGVIQPMEEIFNLTQKYGSTLVSDCMQAFGKIFTNFSLLDGMTFSGHKIGAGLGSGLTAVRNHLISKEWRFMGGGNQENGHRAGTENFPSIISFSRLAQYQLENMGGTLVKNLFFRNKIESHLKKLGCEIVAENSLRLPHTIFAILPIEGIDFFMMGLEERSILVSTGSSCKSRAREPSSSLLSMGYSPEQALRAIRISYGCLTTDDEVDYLLKSFELVLKSLDSNQ
jgi:cysteine desulfurase